MESRDQVVRELLRSFNTARETLGRSAGIPGDGDSAPCMSELWYSGSYRQLEQALLRMRSDPGSFRGFPVAKLYWHIAERYLRCTYRNADVWVTSSRKHGRRERLMQRHIVRVYSPGYLSVPETRRLLLRDLGVRWLVLDFERRHNTPCLPRELLEAAA